MLRKVSPDSHTVGLPSRQYNFLNIVSGYIFRMLQGQKDARRLSSPISVPIVNEPPAWGQNKLCQWRSRSRFKAS